MSFIIIVNPDASAYYPLGENMFILVLYKNKLPNIKEIFEMQQALAEEILGLGDVNFYMAFQNYIEPQKKDADYFCFDCDTLNINCSLYSFLKKQIKSREYFSYFFLFDQKTKILEEIFDEDDLKNMKDSFKTRSRKIPAITYNFWLKDGHLKEYNFFEPRPDFTNRFWYKDNDE